MFLTQRKKLSISCHIWWDFVYLMKVSSTILGEISSVISIIPLEIFHSRFWTFLLFDFPSIPHLATLSHLCGICICNANCTYWQYESVGRKNWDIQLYFPLLYYVTQTPQLLLMFGHFCFYVEIQPHFFCKQGGWTRQKNDMPSELKRFVQYFQIFSEPLSLSQL